MRLDELSSLLRLLRRRIEHSSSRRIMRLVPVFILRTQPSPSRSEASARKNVDVVRDWDLGVTSPLKVLQNA